MAGIEPKKATLARKDGEDVVLIYPRTVSDIVVYDSNDTVYSKFGKVDNTISSINGSLEEHSSRIDELSDKIDRREEVLNDKINDLTGSTISISNTDEGSIATRYAELTRLVTNMNGNTIKISNDISDAKTIKYYIDDNLSNLTAGNIIYSGETTIAEALSSVSNDVYGLKSIAKVATVSSNGMMSAADKLKVNEITYGSSGTIQDITKYFNIDSSSGTFDNLSYGVKGYVDKVFGRAVRLRITSMYVSNITAQHVSGILPTNIVISNFCRLPIDTVESISSSVKVCGIYSYVTSDHNNNYVGAGSTLVSNSDMETNWDPVNNKITITINGDYYEETTGSLAYNGKLVFYDNDYWIDILL